MDSLFRLALFQPDMPANTGAMMRLCACFGIKMDIIEPCGFPFDDKKVKRVAMDYIHLVEYKRHRSWNDFWQQRGTRRVVLLTTKAKMPYYQFDFHKDDILLVGQESSGVPLDVHQSVDAEIRVPMQPSARSLNVGMAAGIILAEALRQVKGFPS